MSLSPPAPAPALGVDPGSPEAAQLQSLSPPGPLSSFDLRGRTALVTGASTGLGRVFALRLATQGANVVLAAPEAEGSTLQRVQEEIDALPRDQDKNCIQPGRAVTLTLDVTSGAAAIGEAIAKAWEAFGGIDILVNNAGVLEQGAVPSREQSEESWTRTLNVNLLGTALVLQAVAQKMVETKHERPPGFRSIVNLSSILGTERGTLPVAMYSATKAAIVQLTKAMAIELGPHGIRVNSLAPGEFPSNMTLPYWRMIEKAAPHKYCLPRTGRTDPDLTAPLLFLASDASAFVTGVNLIVDGGYSVALKAHNPGQ